jgi:hypothetical protein
VTGVGVLVAGVGVVTVGVGVPVASAGVATVGVGVSVAGIGVADGVGVGVPSHPTAAKANSTRQTICAMRLARMAYLLQRDYNEFGIKRIEGKNPFLSQSDVVLFGIQLYNQTALTGI